MTRVSLQAWQLFRVALRATHMERGPAIDVAFELGIAGAGAIVGGLLAWLFGRQAPGCTAAAIVGATLSFTTWRTFDVDHW